MGNIVAIIIKLGKSLLHGRHNASFALHLDSKHIVTRQTTETTSITNPRRDPAIALLDSGTITTSDQTTSQQYPVTTVATTKTETFTYHRTTDASAEIKLDSNDRSSTTTLPPGT